MSDSLQPYGLQHARPPCPSTTPGACSNWCLSNWWCHPTISFSVVPFSSSLHQGLFQWVSSFHQVAKILEFQLQHKSFNEYSELISLRMDWLDLLAFQTTLKSLLRHHSLTRWTFVGNVMSLVFTMLSRLVIAFLPRSKGLLISCLQSPSTVILDPPQSKVCHCFHCFPISFPWSDGTRCHDLSFLNVEL